MTHREHVRILTVVAVIEGLMILGLIAVLAFRDEPETSAEAMGASVATPADHAPKGPVDATKSPLRAVAPTAEPAASVSSSLPADDEKPVLVVYGRVTDDDGKPIQGSVWFSSAEGNHWSTRCQRSGGLYSIAGLPSELVDVRATATGFEPYEGSLNLAEASSPVEHDIQLSSALWIEVDVVTPDGTPFAETDWEAMGLPHIGLGALASTAPLDRLPLSNLRVSQWSELGRFQDSVYRNGQWIRFQPPTIGVLELRRVAPPFHVHAVMRQTILASTRVSEPVDRVRLVVDPEQIGEQLARVTARFVDGDTGAPLTEGRVALNSRQQGGGGVKPDEDGVVVLETLIPGLLVLTPYFEEVAMHRRYVRVEPGADIDLGTIALVAPRTVSGTVLDEDGKPLGCRITARDLESFSFPQPIDTGLSGTVADDGTYSIPVGRGRHLLLFTSDTGRTNRVVDTSAGDVDGLDVTLSTGIAVTFERTSARPYLWQIIDAQGTPLLSRISATATMQAKLAPGSYTLRAYDDLTLALSQPFTVGAEPVTIQLDL